MAVIIKNVRLEGSKGKIEKEALFDSGATYSCIQPELAFCLGNLEPLPEPLELGTAERKRKVTAKEAVRLDFHLNGFRLSDEFMLIPNLSEPVIIGAKTLQAWRLKLDFEHDEVIVDPRVLKLRLIKLKGETNG
ncbi:MAG: retropepsin-like aspartic protease [bacterium]